MDPTILYDVQNAPFWDWKVALDLFFGGAGVGAFVFSVALYEFWGHRYRRIPQTAAFLAPILVAVGLGFLMLEIGRPFSIFRTFLNFAPTAPLWWGGIFQTLFIVGSVWYAWQWRNQEPNPARRRLGLALTPVAVIVGGYHGMLLAVLPSRPLWNTGPAIVAALAAFVSTGIAAVLLVHLLRMRLAGRLDDADHVATFFASLRPVRNVLVAVLLFQLGAFFLWWVALRFGDLSDRVALEAANAEYGLMFWVLGIGVGVVLPLGLGAFAVWRDRAGKDIRLEIWTIALTSGLILVGGLFFRLTLVLGGQLDPVFVSLP